MRSCPGATIVCLLLHSIPAYSFVLNKDTPRKLVTTLGWGETNIEEFETPDSRWHSPVHNDVCSETGVTLSRYMMEMARLNPELEEIESIFTSLSVACKTLSNLVRTSSLKGITGLEDGGGSINVQGEEQKKLDVVANDVLKRALKWNGKLSTIVSEEEDAPVQLTDNMGNSVFSNDIILESSAGYTAVFDPLDGSSNIDAGIPVGTIFGIFDQAECELDFETTAEELEKQCLQNTLQPGENLVAAGYCLYSSATFFVFTLGNGCLGFTLDENIGEFVLTHPDIKIPARGKIYSFNEANRWDWDAPLENYVTDIQQGFVRRDKRSRMLLNCTSILTLCSVFPGRYENALFEPLHWLHGGRCAPYLALRRHLWVSGRQEEPERETPIVV